MGQRGPQPKDLTGETFNKLTVIRCIGHKDSYKEVKHYASIEWLCECECGRNAIVRGSDLKTGHTKSCGCLRGQNIKDANKYKQMVEEFWEFLPNHFFIESREELEAQAKNWRPSNPLLVALHYIWKREPKIMKLGKVLERIRDYERVPAGPTLSALMEIQEMAADAIKELEK